MKRIFASLALVISMTACGVSQQQEIQMGQDYSQQINAQLPIISDPEINRYVNVLGDQIASRTSRADLPWRFYVVDSREVNAFAVPGGYVYVNTGTLAFLKSDAELQFFLAHEIGHQELKHVAKRITYATRASQMAGQSAGTLAQTAYMTIAMGYSKEQEFEADA